MFINFYHTEWLFAYNKAKITSRKSYDIKKKSNFKNKSIRWDIYKKKKKRNILRLSRKLSDHNCILICRVLINRKFIFKTFVCPAASLKSTLQLAQLRKKKKKFQVEHNLEASSYYIFTKHTHTHTLSRFLLSTCAIII